MAVGQLAGAAAPGEGAGAERIGAALWRPLHEGAPPARQTLSLASKASVQEEGGGGAGKNDPSPQGQVTLECARSCDHNETSKSGRYLRAVETLRQASSRGGA